MKEFIYSTRWCELVFENRNKKYGAYQIRMREADNTLISWLIAAFITLAMAGMLSWMGGPSRELVAKIKEKTRPDIIYDMQQVMATIPSITQPVSPAATQNTATRYIVKDKIIPPGKEPIAPITPVAPGIATLPGITPPHDFPVVTGAGGTAVTPPNANAKNIVDVMPAFPGGEKALLDYLGSHIKYPPEMVAKGISGIVYLGFVIGSDGLVYDIKVIKGVEQGQPLAIEAQRVVGNMPTWTPGKQGGQNVAVNFVLPVNFITR